MPNHATEADVRRLFQLTERQAPPDLVASCLARARLEIGARLDPDADPGDTAARLVDGGALLAGGLVLACLAATAAAGAQNTTVGGQRRDDTGLPGLLARAGEDARLRGWDLLAPVLRREPPPRLAEITGTGPLFGEGERP